FPVYASAYALQGEVDCPLRNKWRERFKPENANAFLYVIKAEIPRHLFLRWGGLQRRLDWKCASSTQL
ncbi:hypothetical protein ACFU8X_26895, partial [Brevibacillus porteri]|uniref:hypothetical protein n=1 Tax=Brevibacillus porteri TaxID=2126350 RepID=UPI00370B5875